MLKTGKVARVVLGVPGVASLSLKPRRREGARRQGAQGDVRHNFIFMTLEGMAANTVLGLVNPFLGVYAIALGASSFLVGLLTAVPALVNTVVFLPAAGMVERRKVRLPMTLLWTGLHRALYVPLAFIPFLPLAPAARAVVLVAIVALMSLPGAVSGVAWTAMVGDMFPGHRRGEVFGLRNMYVGIAGVAGTFVAGHLLDLVRFPGNYLALFLAAAGFGALGLVFLRNMREEEPSSAAPPTPGASLVARTRDLLTDEQYGRKFKSFLASCSMLWFGFGLTAAMWPIYHVEVLHLPNATIGGFAILVGMAAVISSVYWGKVASRRGNRIVLLISTAGFAVYPAMYTLSRSVTYLYLMQAASGVCLGGLNLAVFNLALEYARPGRSASAVALFNMLINAATFVAPFLGDGLYRSLGVTTTLYVGSCVRLASLLFLSGSAVRRPLAFQRTGRARRRRAVASRGD